MKKGMCCLLIEDDPDDQELFMDALHSISKDTGCYAVSNGEEAIRALVDEGLVPDFIFTDLNMPLMGGIEFLSVFRGMEKFRSIPVIVFSSEYSEEVVKKVKALGATAIYSKTRFGVLPEILGRYLANSTTATVL